MRRTCVFFHAHPDDEALLTSGTQARLAAEGHRVVLVVATRGDRGLAAAATAPLGEVRAAELHASAAALGVARVVFLGYGDSGLDGSGGSGSSGLDGSGSDGGAHTAEPPFASADVDEAAERLAAVLREERADLLTAYDPAGGYGHPDHVQVHRVGLRAAALAGTPRVLEATVDRDLLLCGLRLAEAVYRFPPEFDRTRFERAYRPRRQITHRIDVRRYAGAKRASMAAHVSQTTGGDSERTLAALLRLPGPLFRLVLGAEWYVDRSRR